MKFKITKKAAPAELAQDNLVKAVRANNASAVEELLLRGADIHQLDVDSRDMLGITALYGYTDVARVLVAHGADVNKVSVFGRAPPLLVAAYMNHLEVAQFFIDSGADIHATDDKGETAYIRASNANRTEMLHLLDKAAEDQRRRAAEEVTEAAAKVFAASHAASSKNQLIITANTPVYAINRRPQP